MHIGVDLNPVELSIKLLMTKLCRRGYQTLLSSASNNQSLHNGIGEDVNVVELNIKLLVTKLYRRGYKHIAELLNSAPNHLLQNRIGVDIIRVELNIKQPLITKQNQHGCEPCGVQHQLTHSKTVLLQNQRPRELFSTRNT